MSLIQVESSGNPAALSKGNYGLMQVRFATAKELNCGVQKPEDLFVPAINIDCGCKYLAKQHKRYRDWYAAVVAYNQGSVLHRGKIVMDYKGLNTEVMKGVYANQYRTKIFSALPKNFDRRKP